jgi:hypothetical protein
MENALAKMLASGSTLRVFFLQDITRTFNTRSSRVEKRRMSEGILGITLRLDTGILILFMFFSVCENMFCFS